jgi:hypothetical protein
MTRSQKWDEQLPKTPTGQVTDAWWDAGYVKGYSEGYNNSVTDLITWLLNEDHPEAAEALRYALSPDGIAEQNERIKQLYGSLQKLADEARPVELEREVQG